MKTFALILGAVAIFACGIAFQRYLPISASMANRNDNRLILQEQTFSLHKGEAYRNNGLVITGAAATFREDDQDDDLLKGGMFLISAPPDECVLALSAQDTMDESVRQLFRETNKDNQHKTPPGAKEAWIIGRIPGDAGGQPRLWNTEALEVGEASYHDGFSNVRVDIAIYGGPNFDSPPLPQGHYFIIRIVGLKKGKQTINVWPTYHWEGTHVDGVLMPTQRWMKIEFEVE